MFWSVSLLKPDRDVWAGYEEFSCYNKALDLDLEHLGTHEYIGRLYLNLDQPEESKKHFRILKALCYFGSEELKSLEVAIRVWNGKGSKKILRKYLIWLLLMCRMIKNFN